MAVTLSCRGALVYRTRVHGDRVVGCGGDGGVGSSRGHRGSRWDSGDPHCCLDPWPLGAFSAPPTPFQAHLSLMLRVSCLLSFLTGLPPTTRGLASEHCHPTCLSPLGVPQWGQWRWGLPPSAMGVRPGPVWEDWRRGARDAAWSRAGLAGPLPWASEHRWVKEPVRDHSALGCNCQTPLTLLGLYVASGWDGRHPQVM